MFARRSVSPDRSNSRRNRLRRGECFPDQPFDRGDRFVVKRGDDRDRGAGASGASQYDRCGALVIGMMRNVEIEDMGDGWNIEAAGGDIGGHQQRFHPRIDRARGGAAD